MVIHEQYLLFIFQVHCLYETIKRNYAYKKERHLPNPSEHLNQNSRLV